MEYPCFLVALPQMQDEFFTQSVVLITHQDDDGAFGIAINKPIEAPVNSDGEATQVVAELRDATSDKVYEIKENLFRGGPADENSVFVIHDDKNLSEGGTQLGEGLFMSTNPTVLQTLLEMGPRGPRRRYFIGCAAWSKGQLESEIRAGSWIMLPFDERFAFEEVDDKSEEPWATRLWRKVLLAGGLDPLTLVSQGKIDSGYN
ncbi:MAG: YqgE/AlgH family protein [Bdellovibrionota bacterium]